MAVKDAVRTWMSERRRGGLITYLVVKLMVAQGVPKVNTVTEILQG